MQELLRNRRALVLAACDYLPGLNTACSRTEWQFRPLVEARVQGALYKLLLGWIEASPQKTSGRLVSPEVTASAVSWSIFGAALDWSRKGAAPASNEVADQAPSVIVEGLQF